MIVTAKRLDTDTKVISKYLGQASADLGVSLSKDDIKVVTALFDAARNGTSKHRSAITRGILSAIRTVRDTVDEPNPFAGVDDPMSPAEAAEELVLAEIDAQRSRELVLKDSINSVEAAALIHRSRQTIERLRRAGRLLALREGNQWRYPRWQFEPDAPGGVLPRLEEVLRELDLSPTGAALWLLLPAERFGRSRPIDLLRRHQPEPVIQLAREQSYMP